MICTGCRLKNDHADANQADGSYVCFDCRPRAVKSLTASAPRSNNSNDREWLYYLGVPPRTDVIYETVVDHGVYAIKTCLYSDGNTTLYLSVPS